MYPGENKMRVMKERRRNLHMRSIYPVRPLCGAEARKDRAGEGWLGRKAADPQDTSALRLLPTIIIRVSEITGATAKTDFA
jgi:hypothetical protein